jgi:hypothetical protein
MKAPLSRRGLRYGRDLAAAPWALAVRHECWAALVTFALVLAVLYGSVVFGGKTLMAAGFAPNGVTESAQTTGRTSVPVHNVDLGTPAYFEAPVNRLVGDLYRSGEFPLWNPYQGAGTPLAAQGSTRAFFPYQVFENIAPTFSWDFFLLGRLWIAGFFTFLFLRGLLVARSAALAGGLLYMLSGSFVWFINLEQMLNVAMMIPVLLWILDGLLVRRQPWHLFGSMLAIGLVLVAGQPETALYVFLLAGLFALLRIWQGSRSAADVGNGLAMMAGVGLLGLGLSLPLTAQFLQFADKGVTTHLPGAPLGIGTVPFAEWSFGVIFPQFFTSPTWFRWPAIAGVWDFLGGYIGVVGIGLILFALPRRRFGPHRSLFLLFAGFGLGLLLKNFGVPPFVWIGYLPLFDQVWSPRWAGPTWTFALAMAAALAFDALQRESSDEAVPSPASPTPAGPLEADQPCGPPGHTTITAPGGGAPVAPGEAVPSASFMAASRIDANADGVWLPALPWLLPALAVIGAIVFTNTPELLTDQHPLTPRPTWPEALWVLTTSVWAGAVVAVALSATVWWVWRQEHLGARRFEAVLPLILAEAWYLLPHGYDSGFLALKLLPVAAAMAAALLLAYGCKAWFLGAGALAVGGVLALEFASPYGLPDWRDPFVDAPYVAFLRNRVGYDRVVATDGVLMPNYASALQLFDVRYMNSISTRTLNDFLPHLTGHPWSQTDSSNVVFSGRPEFVPELPPDVGYSVAQFSIRDQFASATPQYSLLGVRYLITPAQNEFIYTEGFGDWVPVHLPDIVSGQPAGQPTDFATDSLRSGKWRRVGNRLAPFSPMPQDLVYHFAFAEPVEGGFVHLWLSNQEAGAGFNLAVSTDGDQWLPPALALGNVNPRQIHRVPLPSETHGSRDLWVRMTGWSPSASASLALEQWGLRVSTGGGSADHYRYTVAGRKPRTLRPLSHLPLIYDDEVRIYENSQAYPRAFVTSAPLIVADPEVVWADPSQLAPGEVFVDSFIPALHDPPAGAADGGGEVEIVSYSANRVELQANVSGPSLVVLNDTFYPGWTARVDGDPARIHRVNGLTRGVVVTAGEHTVTFQYSPEEWSWGLVAAGLSVVLAGAWTVRLLHRGRD